MGAKKYFSRLEKKKVVFIALTVFILSSALAWVPYLRAKAVTYDQINQNKTTLESISRYQTGLAKLPTLNSEAIGILGPAKDYADKARQISDDLNLSKLIRPSPLSTIIRVPFADTGPLIDSVNDNISFIHSQTYYSTTNAALADIDRAIAYHAKISNALVNIIEYSPAKDLAIFDSKSSDTKKRIDLAQTGLEKADKDITNLDGTYLDPYFNNLQRSLAGLQRESYILTDTGDKARWIERVAYYQQKIIENRGQFWSEKVRAFNEKLGRIQDIVSIILQRWINTKEKFQI